MKEVFLNYNKNKYDAILIDTFKGLNIPFEMPTYKAVFDEVRLFALTKDETIRQNLILVGIKGENEIDKDRYFESKWALNLEILDYDSNKLLIKDKYAPIGV